MEKTVKKLLVATGLIASAAVALLPLTSYATSHISAPGTPYADYECHKGADPYAPLSTACAYTDQQVGGPTVVTVNVDTVLAIDAVSLTCSGDSDTCVDVDADAKAIQAYPGMVRTGTLTTSIRSAKPFTISISAEDPYLKGYDDSGDFTGFVIPSSNLVDGKSNGWGIQKNGAADGVYSNITAQPTVFLTSDVPQDEFGDFNFKVGVSVKDNVPQGMYSTEVTITAATIGTN